MRLKTSQNTKYFKRCAHLENTMFWGQISTRMKTHLISLVFIPDKLGLDFMLQVMFN